MFPGLQYQPLPWIGYARARRASGTVARWAAIEREVSAGSYRTAMDIGSNVGYFVIALSKRGISTLGVESDDKFSRIFRYALRKVGARNAGNLCIEVNPDTVELLPRTDIIVFMSVFHHWSRYFGWGAAVEMLRTVWSRCDGVMFFETGQGEMPPEYNLPTLEPSPDVWLSRFLRDNCEGAEVSAMGQFQAFAPGGGEARKVVSRELFCVRRSR
jgi:hypothetical protein